MSKRDYYEVLGGPKAATEQDIKSAYRKLAQKYHPDRNPGDRTEKERFKEAADAYAVLADREKRSLYDRFGHAGVGGAAAAGGFDPTIFADFGDILGGLGDIFGFGDLFGGARRRGGRLGCPCRVTRRLCATHRDTQGSHPSAHAKPPPTHGAPVNQLIR